MARGTGCDQNGAQARSRSAVASDGQVAKLLKQHQLGALVGLLSASAWERRAAAAQALGELGDARALDGLVGVLDDRYVQVRAAVCDALGRIGDPRAILPLLALAVHEVSDEARDSALASFELASLARVLVEGDEQARRRMASALGRFGGPAAVEPLTAALEDPDERVRACAALALTQLDSTRAAEPELGGDTRTRLAQGVAGLTSWAAAERARALATVAEFGDAALVPQLAASLQRFGAEQRLGAGADMDWNEIMDDSAHLADTVASVLAALEAIGGPDAERALAEFHALRPSS